MSAGVDKTERLKEKVRTMPLVERLKRAREIFDTLCSEGRQPKRSIPAQSYDEDIFISFTLEDAAEEIERLKEENNQWRSACEGIPNASPTSLRTALREAHEIVAINNLHRDLSHTDAQLRDVTNKLIGEKADATAEIERLKRGDFTEEEFQTLCHNLQDKGEPITAQSFNDGCERYQKLMFGRSPITELKRACRTRPDYDLRCDACGAPHNLDTSIPSHIWNQIAAPGDILCTLCIDERLAAAGLTCDRAEFFYVGKALSGRPYAESTGTVQKLERDLTTAEKRVALLARIEEVLSSWSLDHGKVKGDAFEKVKYLLNHIFILQTAKSSWKRNDEWQKRQVKESIKFLEEVAKAVNCLPSYHLPVVEQNEHILAKIDEARARKRVFECFECRLMFDSTSSTCPSCGAEDNQTFTAEHARQQFADIMRLQDEKRELQGKYLDAQEGYQLAKACERIALLESTLRDAVICVDAGRLASIGSANNTRLPLIEVWRVNWWRHVLDQTVIDERKAESIATPAPTKGKIEKQLRVIETFIREEGQKLGTVSASMALQAVEIVRQQLAELRKETEELKKDRDHWQAEAGAFSAAEDAARVEVERLNTQMEKSTAELRRYITGNGFTWAEEESAVFNVTTVIGQMGGMLEARDNEIDSLKKQIEKPVDMLLFCPKCGTQHVDEAKPGVCETCGHSETECTCNEFTAWLNPPHKSHRCSSCNFVFRPADVPTNGVAAIKSKGERDGDPRPHYLQTAFDEAKSYKGEWQMYAKAWQRELGNCLIPKTHLIDALVLTTRKVMEERRHLQSENEELKSKALFARREALWEAVAIVAHISQQPTKPGEFSPHMRMIAKLYEVIGCRECGEISSRVQHLCEKCVALRDAAYALHSSGGLSTQTEPQLQEQGE